MYSTNGNHNISLDYDSIKGLTIFKNTKNYNSDLHTLIEYIINYLEKNPPHTNLTTTSIEFNIEFNYKNKPSSTNKIMYVINNDVKNVLRDICDNILEQKNVDSLKDDYSKSTSNKKNKLLNTLKQHTPDGVKDIYEKVQESQEFKEIKEMIKQPISDIHNSKDILRTWLQLEYIVERYQSSDYPELKLPNRKLDKLQPQQENNEMNDSATNDTWRLIIFSSIVIIGVTIYLLKKKKRGQSSGGSNTTTTPYRQNTGEARQDKKHNIRPYAIFIIKTADVPQTEDLLTIIQKSYYFAHEELDKNAVKNFATDAPPITQNSGLEEPSTSHEGQSRTYTVILIEDNSKIFSQIATGNLTSAAKEKLSGSIFMKRRDNVGQEQLKSLINAASIVKNNSYS